MSTTITNEATTVYQYVGSASTETVSSNTNSIVLEDASGLTITKTPSATNFAPGDIITYTVTITNNTGSYLTGVRIIDNLGAGNLAYVSGSATVSTLSTTYPVTPVSTSPLGFALQQLNVGQTMTLTYRAQVIFNLSSSVSLITNSIQGIGYTADSTVSGYANSTISRVSGSNVTSRKTSSVSEVYPRQILSYYITLSNNNSQSVANVISIVDELPQNFVVTNLMVKVGSLNAVMLNSGDYSLISNVLTVTSVNGSVITIPAGETTVLTINGYFE